jgi:hypothetical protein
MTLQSLGSFDVVGDTLARMVAKGRCTIDDLDHRPPGADTSYNPKNMLRDWISVNATNGSRSKMSTAMSLNQQ